MKNITLIASVDNNYGLGKDGDLLYRLPLDLAHFKLVTRHHIVIMGHNTYKSLGKPLKNRENIVLTSKDIEIPGTRVAHSLDEIKDVLESDEEKFIIGGESLYSQFIEDADKLIITHVWDDKLADTFFPRVDFDKMKAEPIMDVWGSPEFSIMCYYPKIPSDMI